MVLSITFCAAQSADDRSKVEKAMLGYLEGFYEGDSVKIVTNISDKVVKYGYWKSDKTNKYEGEPMSYQQMIQYAVKVKAKSKQKPAGIIKKVEIYEVNEQIASGKVTAFWGIDYLLLYKEGDQWKISMILWQGPLAK